MAKLHLARVEGSAAPALERFADRTIFQTTAWLNFVAATQKAEPVLAVVQDGDRTVGRFAGLVLHKYGMRILGSPFPGWTTAYMGFNLDPAVSRTGALLALVDFAFRDLGCVHLEIMDRRIRQEEARQLGFSYRSYNGYEIDLTLSEAQLFAEMDSACRRCIRKAEKMGVRIEEANDAAFVDEYYDQLQDVFAKQKLVPTYPKERVQSLVEHLVSTGQLLLLRARSCDGVCVATGIFPALNDTTYFWGGASYRQHQILRPNEAIQWYAMRYWKARGIKKFDFGGDSDYKRKYGGYEITVPWIRKSKYPVLELLRSVSQGLFAFQQQLRGLRKH